MRITLVNMPALNTTQFIWIKNKMPHRARPTGTIFLPEIAAEAILFAAENDRREVMVGYTTVEATLGEKVIPGVLDHYLAKAAWDGAMLPEPADPNQLDNFGNPCRSTTARMANSTKLLGISVRSCGLRKIARPFLAAWRLPASASPHRYSGRELECEREAGDDGT